MSETEFIRTRGSALKKNAADNFEVVTFESYKAKKTNKNVSETDKKTKMKTEELNMKQAKHEIIKFGMSGFDSRKKEEAKIQLAIKLGAKPPKNKYKNYKVLLLERKQQNKANETIQNLQQLGKNKLGKSIAKGKSYDRKRKNDKGGFLNVYGKVNKAQLKKDAT